MTIWTTNFWRGALDRAIKTFFQTFVAVAIAGVGADAVGLSAGLLDVSWLDALSVAGLATLLSVATAIGNADNTAKVGHNEPGDPPQDETDDDLDFDEADILTATLNDELDEAPESGRRAAE